MATHIAIIDFETANSRSNSACQIGVVLLDNWHIVDEREWLIRPQRMYFSPQCIRVHGITARDCLNSPQWDSVWGELHPFIIRTDENTVSFIAITQQAPPEICKIDDPVRLTPASRTVPLPVEKRPTTADAVAALALEPAKVPSLFITASDATPRMPADDTGVVVMPAGLGKTEVTHAQAQAHSCLVPPTVPVSTAPTDTITDIKLEPAKDLASDAKRHLLTADDTGVSVVQAGRQVTLRTRRHTPA